MMISLFSAGLIALFAGWLWLGVWMFRRFGITFVLWKLGVLLTGTAVGLWEASAAARKSAEKIVNHFVAWALASLDTLQSFKTLTDLNLAWPCAFRFVVSGSLLILAVSEMAHHGPRIDASFEPNRAMRLLYRIRWLFGVLAVLFTLAPPIVTYYWAGTLP